jgi:hypothetical protein
VGVTTLSGGAKYRVGIAKSLFPRSQRFRTHAENRRCLIQQQVAHLLSNSFTDFAA